MLDICDIIIGSNSFLAQTLIELLQGQVKTIGFYNKNCQNHIQRIDYYNIDKLEEISKHQQIRNVYFISSYIPSGGTPEDLDLLINTNINLPLKISKLLANSKIIFCSSVAVYGDLAGVRTEVSNGTNLSLYGSSKLFGEKIIERHNQFSILRFSSIYGPGMKLNTFIPMIIKSALTNKKITLYGDGSRKQNYIHVRDAASYLIAANQESKNSTYLATSIDSYSNLEIAQIIANYLNVEIEFQGIDHSICFEYNNQASRDILNFEPKINLKDGILEVIEWIKKQS